MGARANIGRNRVNGWLDLGGALHSASALRDNEALRHELLAL
jgi:hypothetical protein